MQRVCSRTTATRLPPYSGVKCQRHRSTVGVSRELDGALKETRMNEQGLLALPLRSVVAIYQGYFLARDFLIARVKCLELMVMGWIMAGFWGPTLETGQDVKPGNMLYRGELRLSTPKS